MSELRATLGPWTVGEPTEYMNQLRIEPTIGVVYGAGEEIKANAHLIAAAPELYEALENLTRLANFPKEASYKEVFEAWGKARAALAKARGEG